MHSAIAKCTRLLPHSWYPGRSQHVFPSLLHKSSTTPTRPTASTLPTTPASYSSNIQYLASYFLFCHRRRHCEVYKSTVTFPILWAEPANPSSSHTHTHTHILLDTSLPSIDITHTAHGTNLHLIKLYSNCYCALLIHDAIATCTIRSLHNCYCHFTQLASLSTAKSTPCFVFASATIADNNNVAPPSLYHYSY